MKKFNSKACHQNLVRLVSSLYPPNKLLDWSSLQRVFSLVLKSQVAFYIRLGNEIKKKWFKVAPYSLPSHARQGEKFK